MTEETALIDPSLIKQVRETSGESTVSKMPFIPLITINNKSTEKEVEIEGKITKVKVPPEEGFNVKTKEGEEIVTNFYGKTLEGVVLKERYRIISKWKKNPAPGEKYYSFEFDTWDEPIQVYDDNHQIITEAPYKALKKEFEINEVDSRGNKGKSFDTMLILYLDIGGEVFRFQWKMTSDNGWFDYKNGFGQADTYVAHKTKFNLHQKQNGDITYYWVEYEKGDSTDLAKEIEMQKDIQQYFNAQKVTKARDEDIEVLPTILVEKPEQAKVEEVDVESIPF